MNGSLTWIRNLVEAVASGVGELESIDVVVCPTNVHVQLVASLTSITKSVFTGAQDVSEHSSGAYTGEVSAAMLKEFGCDYAIVGHSERRQYHDESDRYIAAKAKAALEEQITPIVCVGETLEQRNTGQTLEVVENQLKTVVKMIEADLNKIAIAYEPVWAIGTGKVASPEQAQEVHGSIRGYLGRISQEAAADCRILYGGSVKGDNAPDVLGQADVDGFLVGGASLDAEEFLRICRSANC